MTTRNTQLNCLALAGVLTLGATIAWFVAGMMAGNAIVDRWFRNASNEGLYILPDGTPVVCAGQIDEEGLVCRGLDGRRVKARRLYYGSNQPETAQTAVLGAWPDPKQLNCELNWNHRIFRIPVHSLQRDTVLWYFVHDGKLARHGYFVGFDADTKLKVGYIGRNGRCADEPPPENQFAVDRRRFVEDNSRGFFSRDYYVPADLSPHQVAELKKQGNFHPFTIMFLADDGLMRVNLKEQTVTCLRKADNLISAAVVMTSAVESGSSAKGAEPMKEVILLRTPDRVQLVDTAGKDIETYLLPKSLRDCDLQWLDLPGDQVLVRARHLWWDNELFWINPKGNVVRHEKVDLVEHHEFDRVRKDLPLSLIAPSPAAVAVLAAAGVWSSAFEPGYWPAIRRALTEGWFPLVVGLLSVVSTCLCYSRQRKYAMPWTGAWVAFVFLTGLPGYIGYIAHRRWPSRLPCPHCGRHVPRDRPACIACGREFPPPAMKGIEVFAEQAH
jgi:hypothetical protein